MDLVSLVTTFVVLALIGFLLWLLVTKIPMLDAYKSALEVIAVVMLVLYVLAVITGHAELIRIRG